MPRQYSSSANGQNIWNGQRSREGQGIEVRQLAYSMALIMVAGILITLGFSAFGDIQFGMVVLGFFLLLTGLITICCFLCKYCLSSNHRQNGNSTNVPVYSITNSGNVTYQVSSLPPDSNSPPEYHPSFAPKAPPSYEMVMKQNNFPHFSPPQYDAA